MAIKSKCLQRWVYNLVKSHVAHIEYQLLDIMKPTELRTIGEWITTTIDFETSIQQHRTVVAHGVDVQLDNIKRTYDGMGSLLTRVVEALCNEVPEWARGFVENCIFYPQLGFLTVVPLDLESGKAMYEGEGMDGDVWQRMFVSEAKGYYKNIRMKEMDDMFGDMYGMICGKSCTQSQLQMLMSCKIGKLRSSMNWPFEFFGMQRCLYRLLMCAVISIVS